MTVYETDAHAAYGGGDSVETAGCVGRSVVPLVNWIGAGASVALIAGLGVWGYNLAMRDVTGIPVIQALEGPMRVQPDDPGGRQAEHQGLAVNAVQADGVAEAPVDRIVLAPSPIDLSTATPAQDPATLEATRPVPSIPTSAAGPIVTEVSLTQDLAAAGPPMPLIATPDDATAERDASDRDSTGLAVEALLSTLVEDQEALDLGIVPASLPGIARSPRPRARPATQVASRAIMDLSAPRVLVQAPAFVDTDTLVAGARMVQFGAYDDEASARSEWEAISANFNDYLEGKAPVIQQAERAGRTFFRLRATGFEDLAEARQFCSVFLAEDLACIPVVYK